MVSRSRLNTFLRVTICSVSGCIGRIEEKFNAEHCLGLQVFLSLIVTQFRDLYIQVKNNEIVDSGSLKGDRVRYMQVTALCRSTLQ